MPTTSTNGDATTRAGRRSRATYVQVPFTDDVGRQTPTGRTFDVFQLVSDPGDARSSASRTRPAVQSDVHAVTSTSLKRMTGKWQLNASVTWLRATGRVQESRLGSRPSSRGRPAVPRLRQEPQRLRQHRRPAASCDVPWNVQGPGRVPAARRLPGLGELLAPQRRPHRAPQHALTEATIGRPRGTTHRCSSSAVSPGGCRGVTAPRHAAAEGLQAGQDARASRSSWTPSTS